MRPSGTSLACIARMHAGVLCAARLLTRDTGSLPPGVLIRRILKVTAFAIAVAVRVHVHVLVRHLVLLVKRRFVKEG